MQTRISLTMVAVCALSGAADAQLPPPEFCDLSVTIIDPARPREVTAASKPLASTADGSIIAVGDSNFRDHANLELSGVVHILERSDDEWKIVQRLHAPDPAFGQRFGNAVAMSEDGSVLLIGARLDGQRGVRAGAAYVFERKAGTYQFSEKMLAPDGAPEAQFGANLALSADGSLVVISATQARVAGIETGKAYVFERKAGLFAHSADLIGADLADEREFGFHVAMTPDASVALIAAPVMGSPGGEGLLHWFERTPSGWEEGKPIRPDAPSGVLSRTFAMRVDVSDDGRHVIVGAPFDADFAANLFGAAYLFERTGTTWTQRAALLDDVSGIETPIAFGVTISPKGHRAAYSARNLVRVLTRRGKTWSISSTLSGAASGFFGSFANGMAFSPDGDLLIVDGHETIDRRTIRFFGSECGSCEVDCTGDGVLDVFDFLCFQDLFKSGNPAADLDGDGAFQNAFIAGCE
jgi:hypothetical protein